MSGHQSSTSILSVSSPDLDRCDMRDVPEEEREPHDARVDRVGTIVLPTQEGGRETLRADAGLVPPLAPLDMPVQDLRARRFPRSRLFGRPGQPSGA